MRWLTNTYDPNRPDWEKSLIPMPGETLDAAARRGRDFLRGKVIGEPRATESFSVEQLHGVDIVGVYEPESEAAE